MESEGFQGATVPPYIYGGVSGKKVIFDPPPNQVKTIVKFNTNYVPRLAQVQPEPLLSIPEVFLPTLVTRLSQTTFFTDVKQTPWYVNNCVNNCVVNLIRMGDLDKLKLSVKKGLHIDRIIRSGKTLLTVAVLAQKPEILAWLLSKGANPNIVDDRGNTCLEYATSFNNTEILKLLFSCLSIPVITKRRACLLIKRAHLYLGSSGSQKPQHVEVIKSFVYYSLGLSAEEYKQFVYTLENKNEAILNGGIKEPSIIETVIATSSQDTSGKIKIKI